MKRFQLISLFIVAFLISCLYPSEVQAEKSKIDFKPLQSEFHAQIKPILNQFCNKCHSTEDPEGELDLERFKNFEVVRKDPKVWQKVKSMLVDKEMPPKKSRQPTDEQKKYLLKWTQRYLDAEALAREGDPGPVVLRRLNNSEYTYTIRDLTGVSSLNPAHQFPTDSASGEGFLNTGNSLVMSPALIQKYFDAGKKVAEHLVLLPDGFRFSPHTTRRDLANELVQQIRYLYSEYTSGASDTSSLDRWAGVPATRSTAQDGRVNLAPYFSALMKNREALIGGNIEIKKIASENKINSKYLRILFQSLIQQEPQSIHLKAVRELLLMGDPSTSSQLHQLVRAVQEKLFRFNAIGHLGLVMPWQASQSNFARQDHLSSNLPAPNAEGFSTLYLQATSLRGEAELTWERLRIEREGRPPIALKDLAKLYIALKEKRNEVLTRTDRYLEALFKYKSKKSPTLLKELEREYQLDSKVLAAWLNYLALSQGGKVEIKSYLNHPIKNVAGWNFVNGWGLQGVRDFSLIGNSSDREVRIPGRMSAHRITVHPRPERWIAAGWLSPIQGSVNIDARVDHAHDACGNGIAWRLESHRGKVIRVIDQGVVPRGSKAKIKTIEKYPIQKGELISLVIDSHQNNHSCDLTEIDLHVQELGNKKRLWDLDKDCADSITESNPHRDRFGNEGIWHFYSGLNSKAASKVSKIYPAGSLIDRWLSTSDPTEAKKIANKIHPTLTSSVKAEITQADVKFFQDISSLEGALLSSLDYRELIESVSEKKAQNSGLEVQYKNKVESQATITFPVRVPQEFSSGAKLLVTGRILTGDDAVIQFSISNSENQAAKKLQGNSPFVVSPGGQGEAYLKKSEEAFRNLFPLAMCHARIVPVDEVVTLLLYHREDQHLQRLMLDEEGKRKLDRLWEELFYISQNAFRVQVSLEQILEFATQDADPRRFDPVLKPVADMAEAYKKQLLRSEPFHLKELLRWAQRAYRRGLKDQEKEGIHSLYRQLKAEGLSHEESMRLLVARVLTSPAFLYRLEKPFKGKDSGPVNSFELATRLSYFLTSSLPDKELTQLAQLNELLKPVVLKEQARRLLKAPSARRLAIEFACQWLHLRDFEKTVEKNERLFPEYSKLRKDMAEETILFFQALFQNDGSVLEIFDSDYSYLNQSLAEHYGIQGVKGEQFRRVEGLKKYSRGGILSHATVLASQSSASRTSPILRGTWLSETLLGERLPRPPKNVPQLPERPPESLTERQLTEMHSSVPECAKCHARIDPYGFSLENFDTIGRFRTRDGKNQPLDTSSRLPDGTELKGFQGLKQYLLTTRRDSLLRQFCRKLLGYALGRSVELSDEPLLTKMQKDLAANGYRISAAIEAIVESRQFRNIRGEER